MGNGGDGFGSSDDGDGIGGDDDGDDGEMSSLNGVVIQVR